MAPALVIPSPLLSIPSVTESPPAMLAPPLVTVSPPVKELGPVVATIDAADTVPIQIKEGAIKDRCQSVSQYTAIHLQKHRETVHEFAHLSL